MVLNTVTTAPISSFPVTFVHVDIFLPLEKTNENNGDIITIVQYPPLSVVLRSMVNGGLKY